MCWAFFLDEDSVQDALPGGHLSELLAVLVDLVPGELAAASVNIDLVGAEPTCSLPDETTDPEDDDDGKGEVRLEEALDIVEAAADGADGDEKLSDQDEDDEDETEVRAIDTTSGLEGNLIQSVTLESPSLAEADMGQADGTPGEEGGKTRQGEEPVEDNDTGSAQVDVGEGTESANEEHGDERAAGTVDVGEDLGGITLLGKGSEGTGTTIDGGNTDGKDGDQDNDVHERIIAAKIGIETDQDEGRSLDVDVRVVTTEETVVIVADEETDEGETQDVEEGDTPEHLLDGTRKRLDGVAGLSSGKTDQLSSGEGESSSDEDGAEATEAVGESARILPKLATRVFVVSAALGTTTTDEDDGNDHEDDSRSELENRRPELLLSVSESAENVDDDDGKHEDGDPDSCRKEAIVSIPLFDCFGCFVRGCSVKTYRH